MKKCEVYNGYRFPCETDMFYKSDGRIIFYDTFYEDKKEYVDNEPYVYKKDMPICPCGKGCKPIKCKVVVYNGV